MFLIVQMRDYMCYIGVRTNLEKRTVDFCLVKSEEFEDSVEELCGDDEEEVCVVWNVNELNNRKKEFYLTITNSLGVAYILTAKRSFGGIPNVDLTPLDTFDMEWDMACYLWRQDGDYLTIKTPTKMYWRTYVPILWAAKRPSFSSILVSQVSDATPVQMVESFDAHSLK